MRRAVFSYRKLSAAVLAAVTLLVTVCSGAVFLTVPARAAEPPELTGKEQVYLYNFDYDTEIFHSDFADKDANEYTFFPASSVKLMTGLIACEELGDKLDHKITVTAKMLDGLSGQSMSLKAGEVVTVRDMLYGLLVNCANDAALVLAYEIADDVSIFVDLMNEKARMLGMFHTTYKNPTGMHDDGMRTSLRDTAALAKACYANPLMTEITATRKYVMDETNKSGFRNLYNRNWLISNFYNTSGIHYEYEGILGLNAGYTPNGGYCNVSIATKKGLTYLAIVMGGEERKDKSVTSYEVTRTLFDYAFSAFERREVLVDGAVIDEIPVSLSSTVDFVKLVAHVPNGAIYAFLPTDVDFDATVSLSWYTKEEELRAPVKKDTVIGSITVRVNGEPIGTVDLVTAADVERSDFLYMLDRIRSFTGKRFFIVAIIVFVLLLAVYLIVQATKEERAARRKHTAGSPVKISVSGNRGLSIPSTGGRKQPPRAVRRPSGTNPGPNGQARPAGQPNAVRRPTSSKEKNGFAVPRSPARSAPPPNPRTPTRTPTVTKKPPREP